MAGVNDSPVRRLAKRYGADLVVSEMVAAKGLYMVKRQTAREKLLSYACHASEEKPFCVQLFGHEPETFTKAAQMVMDIGADLVDINCGCPVRKVVNSGSGSALMKDIDLIGRIVEATRKAGDFPLTVKLRLGWDDSEKNFLDAAKVAVNAGADALILHGRTRSQMFGGNADWDAIAQLVREVSVPVIGNGDVNGPDDAIAMFEQTGCQGIMIGRGANGKPWIFNQIKAAFEGRPIPSDPSPMEVHEIFQEHFRMLVEEKGEALALRLIRKQLIWYTRALPGATAFRRMLFNFKKPKTVLEAAKRFFENALAEREIDAEEHSEN